MKVAVQKDGTFAFLFEQHEKTLGVAILQSMRTDNPAVAHAIETSIQEIQFAAMDFPDNVVPIR